MKNTKPRRCTVLIHKFNKSATFTILYPVDHAGVRRERHFRIQSPVFSAIHHNTYNTVIRNMKTSLNLTEVKRKITHLDKRHDRD